MRSRRRAGRARRPPPQSAPYELPSGFRARMASLLGPDTDAFLEALAAPAAGLRVNTLRLSPERFRDISPFELAPTPYPSEGFLVRDDARPGAHPYHAAGLYYLQDPGAMVVGALPHLGEEPRVLDLAAAPGGKATHLAARMQGRGVLVANDVNGARARELAGNLERMGVRNAIVTSDSPARLADRWGGWFDLVLVDAPCSGESMFHKSEAARREWSPTSIRGCSRRQGELLLDAVRLLRPGGTLLYSTCTFAPEENEEVIATLLDEVRALEVVPLDEVPGADPARPDWLESRADARIARAIRLWPHRFPGAGHFIAALGRAAARDSSAAGGLDERFAPEAPHQDVPAESLRLMREFFADSLPGLSAASHHVIAEGEALYALPPESPPLAGLRVLRPGWWLGSARKGRFEPSHSLAMAIAPAETAQALTLEAGSPDVSAYLRGESLRRDGAKGWLLISVEGYPLGWGKRSDGVVKNHYPRGLRRR